MIKRKSKQKLLCLSQRSFCFGRYNLRPFTDTNSVICKKIVGDGFPVPPLYTFDILFCNYW